ncbi:MAG: hypothetical protein GWN58_25270 [Anaerolineae bacterium]|nr:hypothetical protein [Anaerolineae bacterium]
MQQVALHDREGRPRSQVRQLRADRDSEDPSDAPMEDRLKPIVTTLEGE